MATVFPNVVLIVWMVVIGSYLRSVIVGAVDCQNHPGSFHYNFEECYNSTHILEQAGSCIDGVTNLNYAIFKKCEHAIDPNKDGFCHECGNSLVVCSNSDQISQACNETNLDTNNMCQSNISYSLSIGCNSWEYYFRNSHSCNNTTNVPNNGTALQHQLKCGDSYPDFSFCLACPGTQLCVQNKGPVGNLTCASLNLQQGFSQNNISLLQASPTFSPTYLHDFDASFRSSNTSSKPSNNSVFYIPIDPADPDYSCTSFHGDVNFYFEDCFNSSHSMIISGTCINDTLAYGSRAIAPCENAGAGLSYCHKCVNKLVCASMKDKEKVCASALWSPQPPRCPRDIHDDSLPRISSTFSGCHNESNFYYSYEYCGPQKDNSSLLQTYSHSEISPCFDNYEQLGYCAGCRDGVQLCSREKSSCSNHNYKEELAKLSPPLDCHSITANVDYFWERCYNATHTVVWSGRCINGKPIDVAPTIQSCADSGHNLVFCHECSLSQIVCSQSTLTRQACSVNPTLEEIAANHSDPTNTTCVSPGGNQMSFTGGCIDSKTFHYAVVSCTDGEMTIDQTSKTCGETFEGFPFCISCDSFQLCSATQKSCLELGLGGGGSATNEFDDGMNCDTVIPNINYYVEECFNSSHVKLSHGECNNGTKINQETILQSCVEYGADPSRQYCHTCGFSVVCSSMELMSSNICEDMALLTLSKIASQENLANDSPTNLDLPSCLNGTSYLAGSFGCVSDEIYGTLFQTCGPEGRFMAERNAYYCSQSFPGYSYCQACGKVNICSTKKEAACNEMGSRS